VGHHGIRRRAIAARAAGRGAVGAGARPRQRYFLREIGKGLSYLHDCGIVIAILKPGNIFYENGYVKIGDYGLSKTMSMTRHSGQTVAVGTLQLHGAGNRGGTFTIEASTSTPWAPSPSR